MPFSGVSPNKSFARSNGVNAGTTTWQQDEAAVVGITSTRHDSHDQDIADAINTSLQKDGSNKATAVIDAGGYGFTSLGTLSTAAEATVSVSTTTNVLASASLQVLATGAGATITSLGSATKVALKRVRFDGINTLTHHSTTLILPGGANITTAAGDTMWVESDASGNARVVLYQQALTAPSAFPSGTLMLFQQTAAPTGWTKQTTHNDKALRVVSGTASSGGTTAFSTIFAKTATDAYTLLAADIPSHTHTQNSHNHTQDAHTHTTGGAAAAGSNPQLTYGAANATTVANTGSTTATNQAATAVNQNTGGGGSHSHGMDIRVLYVDLIIASKD